MHNHIILLYTTTIHLPTRSHTTYFLHFRTRSIHPTRMSFLTTIPQKQVFLLFFTFSHLCITHPLGLISVYMCTCNMMQLSYELQLVTAPRQGDAWPRVRVAGQWSCSECRSELPIRAHRTENGGPDLPSLFVCEAPLATFFQIWSRWTFPFSVCGFHPRPFSSLNIFEEREERNREGPVLFCATRSKGIHSK